MSLSNGSDIEPPSTRSMWGDMFGLGPLLRIASDPAIVHQALGMLSQLAEAGAVNRRLEAKLDILLAAGGHDLESINRAIDATARPNLAFLPQIDGTVGAVGAAATGRPSDDGAGRAAAAARGPGDGGGAAPAAGNGAVKNGGAVKDG